MVLPKTQWNYMNYTVEIIDREDPINKNNNGYKRTGEVIYKYLSPRDVKGKIGAYKQASAFIQVWERSY
tara:strand:- start:1520 stop:1726 length:207 start_codon:yes stop_codon:yes gene_type:complete